MTIRELNIIEIQSSTKNDNVTMCQIQELSIIEIKSKNEKKAIQQVILVLMYFVYLTHRD